MKKLFSFLLCLVLLCCCLCPRLIAGERTSIDTDTIKIETVNKRKLVYTKAYSKIVVFYEDELPLTDTLLLKNKGIHPSMIASVGSRATYSEKLLFNAINKSLKNKVKCLADKEIILFIMLKESGEIARLQFGFAPELLTMLTSEDISRLNEHIKRGVKFKMPTQTVPYTQRIIVISINDLLRR